MISNNSLTLRTDNTVRSFTEKRIVVSHHVCRRIQAQLAFDADGLEFQLRMMCNENYTQFYCDQLNRRIQHLVSALVPEHCRYLYLGLGYELDPNGKYRTVVPNSALQRVINNDAVTDVIDCQTTPEFVAAIEILYSQLENTKQRG